ncbi:MAG: YbaB/EbfC family nucleoid-associated protein [Devosia sp.]
MKDIMGMMKAAGEMKAKMEAMQAELAELVVEGNSAGGMVVVALTGKGDMRGLKIDPSLLKPEDAEMVEDLIIAAFNDAKGKSEAEAQRKMAEVTAGLPIPPGMKLPF